MYKKAMISQPMAGKTEEEIVETWERAIKELQAREYAVINTLFPAFAHDETEHIVYMPLFYLAKSLECMSYCHTVYFCKGWENARGCWIEHEAANAYGLEIIYEED